MAAWRHIADEYERLGATPKHRQRYAASMSAWIHSAIQEERARRSDEILTLERAKAYRIATIGMSQILFFCGTVSR